MNSLWCMLSSMMIVSLFYPVNACCQDQGKKSWAIAIHGGTLDPARLSAERRKSKERVLKEALSIGTQLLKAGEDSIDVVQRVVMHLEDAPEFNAGKGAVFNSEGHFELDSSIMDGKNKACGAVAGVSRIKNPIASARLVMKKTRHVLLAGSGAERFASSQGVQLVSPDYFWTAYQRARWRKFQQTNRQQDNESKGTVGCVVLDRKGNLAAGTSTGGLSLKMPGRVGDSPIIGAGTYADNETCAVSCTGTGEEYIRHAIAFHVSARIAYAKDTLDQAVKFVLTKKLKPGDGGIISVDRFGNVSTRFNTKGMSHAAANSSGMFRISFGD